MNLTLSAFLRKKALHDSQEYTPKFFPNAASPQISHLAWTGPSSGSSIVIVTFPTKYIENVILKTCNTVITCSAIIFNNDKDNTIV